MNKQKVCLFLVVFFISLIAKSQQQEAKDSIAYNLKAKLINAKPTSPGCGIFAWAVGQKFEVIESNSYLKPGSTIIIIQPCPELLGANFLKNGSTYSIKMGRGNNAPFSFIVINDFEKDKFPIMWCREIKLAE
jgi:hypothetical protein